MERVYGRAMELFKALFTKDDEIIIATNAIFEYKLKHQIKKLNLYPRYIKKKQLLRNLKLDVIPDIFAEEDEIPDPDDNTYRYMINCKVSDVDYINLVKAICNQNVGRKPSFHHAVFFLNLNKGIILHIYDDRGCDVISSSASALKNIYTKYHDWISDDDRESINKTFDGLI